MKTKVGDTIEYTRLGVPRRGIVRYIGKLHGSGEEGYLWSEWGKKDWNGIIGTFGSGGELTYIRPSTKYKTVKRREPIEGIIMGKLEALVYEEAQRLLNG